MIFATVELIPLERLGIALIPVGAVLIVLGIWSIGVKTSLWALGRMLVQLSILGYLLHHVFDANSSLLVLGVLSVMLAAASWIALRVNVEKRRQLYPQVFVSIVIGGGATLIVITQGVLRLDPWYLPQTMIPLAGMIFSSSMSAISLAVERFFVESDRGETFLSARQTALKTALIPITNSLLAVGIVSVPGFMASLIVDGRDATIAARHQIMVMCMMFASAGLSASLILAFLGKNESQSAADNCLSRDHKSH